MSIESQEDLAGLRAVGKIVAATLQYMLKSVRPGISTGSLDVLGRRFFERSGARSAPELTYGFPGATCISLNHEAAHGIPGPRIIREGDLVNIDVSLELNGYFADTGASMCVEPVKKDLSDLCSASREILMAALRSLRAGRRLSNVGGTIERESKQRGYKVIRNLSGHGVGRALHEEPFNLLNYKDPSDRRIAKVGQVLAIETFVSTGADYVYEGRDGWTLKTPDRSFVAQFEHTVIVTGDFPVLITA
ncbi:MAG: type I methionyl aminopeptidase [Spirochaetia bacterium]|nr:type I methionyl aminopeptidase [Spirochaetia bacterium]